MIKYFIFIYKEVVKNLFSTYTLSVVRSSLLTTFLFINCVEGITYKVLERMLLLALQNIKTLPILHHFGMTNGFYSIQLAKEPKLLMLLPTKSGFYHLLLRRNGDCARTTTTRHSSFAVPNLWEHIRKKQQIINHVFFLNGGNMV